MVLSSLKLPQNWIFSEFGLSEPGRRPSGVLWVSKVPHGHLGRVSDGFGTGLTTFRSFLTRKSGFGSTLKMTLPKVRKLKIQKIEKKACKVVCGFLGVPQGV